MSKSKKTAKKLSFAIVAIVVLFICLSLVSFALIYSIVSVENNLFETGIVKVNLNDGKPVIEDHEYLLEPGMTIEKSFFLKNKSTCDVYYKLYFDNIEGGLADVLEVSIRQGDNILFTGKISDCTKSKASAINDILKYNERKELIVSFYYHEHSGNNTQSLYLAFDLGADVVQTKNNPSRLFD